MMAYGRLYDCRELVLLYPHHSGLEGTNFPRTFRVNSTDDRLSIATIDIAQNEAIILAALSAVVAEAVSLRKVA